jgi:putative ABC transport system permease protein
MAERRTKEIAVRKALGASVTNVVKLLIKEFIILVVIASIIAWPAAYYAMNKWLQNFAYHVNMGFGTFLLAGLVALIIAIATVSFQAVKAAMANPVKFLRYE